MTPFDLPILPARGAVRLGTFPEYQTVDAWQAAPQYIIRIPYGSPEEHRERLYREYQTLDGAKRAARKLSRAEDIAYARVYSRTAYLTLDKQAEYRRGALTFGYRYGSVVSR